MHRNTVRQAFQASAQPHRETDRERERERESSGFRDPQFDMHSRLGTPILCGMGRGAPLLPLVATLASL